MEAMILILVGIIFYLIYWVFDTIMNIIARKIIKNKLNSLEGSEVEYKFLEKIIELTNGKDSILIFSIIENEISWRKIKKNMKIEDGRIKTLKIDSIKLEDTEIGYNLYEYIKKLIKEKKLNTLIKFEILSNKSKYLNENSIKGTLIFGENVTNLGNISVIYSNYYSEAFMDIEEEWGIDNFDEELQYDIANRINQNKLVINILEPTKEDEEDLNYEDEDYEYNDNLDFYIRTPKSKLFDLEIIPGNLTFSLDEESAGLEFNSLGKIRKIKGNLDIYTEDEVGIDYIIAKEISEKNIEYENKIDFEIFGYSKLLELETIPGNLTIDINIEDLDSTEIEKFKKIIKNIKIRNILGKLKYNEKNEIIYEFIELIEKGDIKAEKIEKIQTEIIT